MSLATLLTRMVSRLTEEERIAFRREQVSHIGFAGLRPVHRVFLGV